MAGLRPVLLAAVLAMLPAGAGAELAGVVQLQARARQVVSFPVSMANPGSGGRTARVEVDAPPGWRVLAGPGTLDLAAGATALRIVSVLVPAGAAAGDWIVTVRAMDDGDSGFAFATQAVVRVAAEPALRVEVDHAPELAAAGSTYEAGFRVVNGGNAAARFGLEVAIDDHTPFSVSGIDRLEARDLGAGCSESFTVTVRTAGATMEVREQRLTVAARLEGQEQGAAATVTVRVVPLGRAGADIVRRIPATQELSASVTFGEASAFSLRETLAVAGALDEAGLHALELDLRLVPAAAGAAVRAPDAWSLVYSGPAVALRLGHQPYAISPLLGTEWRGRGAELAVAHGPLSVSGLVFGEEASGGPEVAGSIVGLSLPAARRGGESVYRATAAALVLGRDRLSFGIDQLVRPVHGLSIGLEGVLQVAADGAPTPALLVAAQGERGSAECRARLVRAWPGFVGDYSDEQRLEAEAVVELARSTLSLSAACRLRDTNLRADPSLGAAVRTARLSLGASALLPRPAVRISAEWEGCRLSDRLVPAAMDRWRNTVAASVSRAPSPLGARVDARFEHTFDAVTSVATLLQEHSASIAYLSPSGLRAGIAVDYEGTSASGEAASHGVGAELAFGRTAAKTAVDAAVRATCSFGGEAASAGTVQIESGLGHTFPWGHTVSMRGRFGLAEKAGGWSPEGTLQLCYRAPLNIPVGRANDSVVIRGRVHRVESGAPVSGVSVRTGGHAVLTDAHGDFAFFLPSSGTHYLSVDVLDAGSGLVVCGGSPVEVAAAPGSTSCVSIGLVQGSALRGSVALYGRPRSPDGLLRPWDPLDAAGAAAERLRGLSEVVVELSGPGVSRRRVTGADGAFTFDALPPGEYAVRVQVTEPAADQTLDQPEVTVSLGPGETRTIEFRAVERLRRIRWFAASGPLVLDTSGAGTNRASLSLHGSGQDAPADGSR